MNLFDKAGYKILVRESNYTPVIDDSELQCIMLHPREVARYVDRGTVDLGITGKDWLLENKADVIEVEELVFSKRTSEPYRWVVAVPNDSPIQTLKDLDGKRIITELVETTRQFLEKNGVTAEVDLSRGATEIKKPLMADAIVEGTETGLSLRTNGLRIVDTVVVSTPRLVANRGAWSDPWKHKKAENLALLLKGVLQAETRVGLKMNVPRTKLDEVIDQLPALHTPTISEQLDPDWVAVEVILDKIVARELISELKKAGAEGIVEYFLNTVIF
jgi:ATP phosphoribosyltransferase